MKLSPLYPDDVIVGMELRDKVGALFSKLIEAGWPKTDSNRPFIVYSVFMISVSISCRLVFDLSCQ